MTEHLKREIALYYDGYLLKTLKSNLERALSNSKDRFYSAGKIYSVKYAIWLLNYLQSNKI